MRPRPEYTASAAASKSALPKWRPSPKQVALLSKHGWFIDQIADMTVEQCEKAIKEIFSEIAFDNRIRRIIAYNMRQFEEDWDDGFDRMGDH